MPLDNDTLHELHALLVDAGLATRGGLDTLASSLAPAVRARLPSQSQPAIELLGTLHELNRLDVTSDGERPIEAWLRSAALLATGTRQERRLREMAAALRAEPLASRPAVLGSPPASEQENLLDQLSALLSAQFDEVVFRVAVPAGYLSGPPAPQATRAIELIRYAQQRHNGEADLRAAINQVRAPASSP